MIRICAVSYLNTIPFIHGLVHSDLIHKIDLNLYYPSICADKLINGEVDLALVPVAILPKLKEAHIISDYCIGSNGAVDTVCIYSDVPIEQIESIALDYQSRTSVALLKILLKEYWKLSPELKKANIGFEDSIKDKNAALVIGDRAFTLNARYKYIYDLSKVWKEMTSLPFVFAAWVTNKKLPQDFVVDFNKSLKNGISNIGSALNFKGNNYTSCKKPKDYLNNKICYNLDSEMRKGMQLFFRKLKSQL